MAENDNTLSKWLAGIATAWLLAATSGAAYVAFSSFGDISALKSTVRAIDQHVSSNDLRMNNLAAKVDAVDSSVNTSINQAVAEASRCASIETRVSRLEDRCDNFFQSDQRKK